MILSLTQLVSEYYLAEQSAKNVSIKYCFVVAMVKWSACLLLYDDASLIPAKVYNFTVKIIFVEKKRKEKKRPGKARPFKNNFCLWPTTEGPINYLSCSSSSSSSSSCYCYCSGDFVNLLFLFTLLYLLF